MGQVQITINNRKYSAGCADGQESELLSLADELNKRVEAIANVSKDVSNSHLLVLAGLQLLNEKQNSSNNAKQDEKLSEYCLRIEALTRSLEKSIA